MKLAISITGPIIYIAVWLYVGFGVGMSHSVPYYKFDQKIYQYYFVIMILELLLFLFLSYIFQRMKGDIGSFMTLIMALYLCAEFPWRIIQFTQYGYGYKLLDKLGINETLMVISVNILPLLLIILTTIYREKLGKLLFGRFLKDRNDGR
jgi:hypothetical protein